MVTKDLGMVTAYAYAVAGGYTGTEAEFTQLMADLAVVVDDFDNFSVNVTTLPAGSSATASYADGVLSLGIPKGDTGATGATGETGAPAGFGTVSATVDDNIGTPSVEVTASGADTAKNFAFAFHNLKGEKGDKGDTGEVSEAELTQAFEDFSENGTVANAEQLTTDIRANDQSPYLFRTSGGSVDIGDREYVNGIVGGTVAWNQLCAEITTDNYAALPTGTLTVNNGEATIAMTSNWSGLQTKSSSTKLPTDIMGHKYFISADIKSSEANNTTGFGISDYGSHNPVRKVISATTSYANYAFIGQQTTGTVAPTDGRFMVYDTAGNGRTLYVKNPMVIDLTQAFGSVIADYAYTLEQGTAGAGVAWFKKLFPKPYYAYNAGELKSVSGLVSHDMTGFNQWDEETKLGTYNTETGVFTANTTHLACKNPIPVVPNTTYYFNTNGYNINVCYLDAEQNYIDNFNSVANVTKTTPSNCHYIVFNMAQAYGTTYNHDICINISWDGSRNGEYEPYELHSYPLDSDLTLRGIPKLDANNNLYYDGDTYEADGTVTRKYGIVDLGSLTWTNAAGGGTSTAAWTLSSGLASVVKHPSNSDVANAISDKYPVKSANDNYLGADKTIAVNVNGQIAIYDTAFTGYTSEQIKTALSGVHLVYELATPTEETADPYQQTQVVNDFGTEEYVIDSNTFAVPVGSDTDYPVNLVAKLEMAPNSPDGSGDYIVRQTNGVNEYVPLVIEDALPAIPSTAGTYTLTVTVADGADPVLSWEA